MGSLDGQRFAIVHADMGVGGAEKQSVILGALLQARGAVVHVFCFEGPGPLAQVCEAAGVGWTVLNVRWDAPRARRAREIARLGFRLRRWQPTVLMPYCDLPNIFCGAIWRFTGARLCIWNQRGVDVFLKQSRLGQAVLRRARCVISNSAYRSKYLSDAYGIDAARIKVVPNAIPVPGHGVDRAAFCTTHGLRDDALLCVMVANFVERKDHRTLLDAWGRLHAQLLPRTVPPVLVLIGRKDAYFESLVPQLDELARSGARVIVLGFQPDASSIVAACDLALFTSTEEGLPNAVLEAMILGKPVIAVDDPSVLEALGGAEPTRRFLVPPNNPAALAERILWALDNRAFLTEAGERNRVRAQREFSEEALVRRTLSVIEPFI